MTLVERILSHRIEAAKYPAHSEEWYRHLMKAADLTREWRQSNILAGVPS